MELEFKKFKIWSDEKQFNLQYKKGEKTGQTFHFSDFGSLLKSIPNKVILKSESTNIDELIKELKDLKYFIERNVNS